MPSITAYKRAVASTFKYISLYIQKRGNSVAPFAHLLVNSQFEPLLTIERVTQHDGFHTVWTSRNDVNTRTHLLFEEADVGAGIGRQIFDPFSAQRGLFPAW